MKILHITLIVMLGLLAQAAVAQQVTFDYDAAGNRIKRQYHVRIVEEPVVQMRTASAAQTTPDSIVFMAVPETETEDFSMRFETIEAKLYPNPTSGWLALDFIGGSVSGSLEIVSLSGQLLQTIPLDTFDSSQGEKGRRCYNIAT